jgi:hypothetical protein
MATTGKTSTIPRPARRKVGAIVNSLPEVSAATWPIGAFLIRTAGSIRMGVTGTVQSTGLAGMACNTGQSLTANGLAKAAFYAFEQGRPIKMTLPGTWTGSAHRGVTAGITMNTAGVVVLQTTAGGCFTIDKEVEWDNGVAVADGDVNVVVYAIPLDAAIAV